MKTLHLQAASNLQSTPVNAWRLTHSPRQFTMPSPATQPLAARLIAAAVSIATTVAKPKP